MDTFQAPYLHSVKEPDAMLRVRDEPLPSLILEVAWSETYPKLVRDVAIWMEGGAATVKVCLLVKLNRRVGNTFAAYTQVARQVRGGGWAFEDRKSVV